MPRITKPNSALFTGADTDPPFLTLMGEKWPIPKFAPKQNTVIVPIIMSLTPKIVKAMNEVEKDDKGAVVMIAMVDPKTLEGVLDDKLQPVMVPKRRSTVESMAEVLDETAMRQLYTCLYYALTRAHPKLKREEFDEEFDIGMMELLDCVFTISDQTGVVKFKKPTPTEDAMALMFKSKAAPAGEAAAADSQTGAQS